jgi:uncharacterized protein (TIGR01244 family)
MSNVKIFAGTLTCTTCIALCVIYVRRPPEMQLISRNVFLSSQLTPKNIKTGLPYGVGTIVDIRPDGEAADEPSHFEMEVAAKSLNLNFFYIPIPHDNIPAEAVNALGEALSRGKTPVVIYCRTGRRAVRTFALAEASRSDGPNASAILAMVRNAGFSADDLQENIAARIAARHPAPEGKD